MALMKQNLSGTTVAIILGVVAVVVVALGAVYFLAPVKSSALRAMPAGSGKNHDLAVAAVRADQAARKKAAEKLHQGEKPEKKVAPVGNSKEGDEKPAAETSGETAARH